MIVAAMIVRNAEETLQRALTSILVYVDKVVAVMAGPSEDNTEEILHDNGVVIQPQIWKKDFSLARTQAFQLARNEGAKWALIMDADDVILDGCNLRGLCADLEKTGVAGAHLRINFESITYWQKRVVNLDIPGTWKCRVHEVYVAGGEWPLRTECSIRHQRGLRVVNTDRNLDIFEEWLREAPQEWKARDFYNYGNEFYWKSRWEDAIRVYGLALGLPSWDDMRYQTHIRRGECYTQIRAWPSAWTEFANAARIHPTWKDAYIHMSRWLYFNKLYEAALAMSDWAECREIPQTTSIVDASLYAQQRMFDEWSKHALQAKSRA